MHGAARKTFFIACFLFAALIPKTQVIRSLDDDSLSINPDSAIVELANSTADEPLSHPRKKRILLIGSTNVSLWAISFVALNKAWYSNYPRSSFHFFNDVDEWNQMDKAGHLWTNYHVTRLSSEMWRWTGLPEKKSVLLGGISGVAYQSIIEIQDAFSQEWGFSWADMTANVAGAATYVFQELAWHDQRIQIKLGYWPYSYHDELKTRRNQLFGKSLQERILKDYNSQTYWVSANLSSFIPDQNIPKWLNISIGYSSDGMYGGTENKWTDKMGNEINRMDIQRVRRIYLAPDVDLTRIKTNSKLLGTVFYVLNMVKFPAPAVEVSSGGKLKFHYVKF